MLQSMRNKLGKKGGVGHFWGNDRGIEKGGERDKMYKEEVRKVLTLFDMGETKVNFKERFFPIFSENT